MEYSLAEICENPTLIRFDTNQTVEKCKQAISRDYTTIQFIKEQTPELCAHAVKISGYAIKYIKNPTIELCYNAIMEDCKSSRYIPKHLLEQIINTPEYKSTMKFATILNYVIDIDDEFLLHDIKESKIDRSLYLTLMCKRFNDFDFCVKAINVNPNIILIIQELNDNIELQELAVSLKPELFKSVKKQTINMYYTIAKKDIKLFDFCRKRDNEMFLVMITVDITSWRHIWKPFDENEYIKLIDRGMNQNPDIIKYVENPTLTHCLQAIRHNPKNIKYVPEIHQTDEVCLIAIEADPNLVKFMCNQNKTIITAVIKKSINALKYIRPQNLAAAIVDPDKSGKTTVEMCIDKILNSSVSTVEKSQLLTQLIN
jgi:hypothetical protein